MQASYELILLLFETQEKTEIAALGPLIGRFCYLGLECQSNQ